MKNLRTIFFVTLLFHAMGSLSQPGYRRVRLSVGKNELSILQKAEVLSEHYHIKNGQLEMELDPEEFKTLKGLSIPFQEIIPPYAVPNGSSVAFQRQQSALAPVNFTTGSMGGYYTYEEAMAIMDEMRSKYPLLVSAKDTLGFTHEGRPVVAFRISDNPGMEEAGEDEWLMTSLHHSNEVMGMSVVFYYIWHLLENYDVDPVIRKLLNNSSLFVIPVVNPDGLAFNESTNPAGGGTWRKNRKPRVIGATTHYGVDLNRNYGYNWGYTHPGQLGQAGSNFAGNSYYRGTAAWSEQETSLIRNFCQSRNFTAAFNYHAWDDSFNYPWNYDLDSSTTDHGIFTAIAAFCTEKNGFEYGTFNQTLGYSANGTSDDWLYGDQATKNKIYSFTIEVGKSFYPAPALIFPYCDSLLDANLKMLKMAASYAEAIETGSDTLHSLSAEVNFSIKRYSIKEKSFTVSLEPLGFPEVPIIVSGAPIVYNDLAFLEDRSGGSIRYTVPASTANGTVVRFLLKVDNGSWTVTDTITKIFIGHTALSLACENTAEPNENITQASALYPGIRVSAAIETSKDQDWFYIDNEIGKENIRILLSGLPSDFDMELRDPDGQVVAIAENAGLANDTIVFNTLRTGRYYLRIYGFHNAFDKYRCYSLSGTLGSGRFAEPVPGKFKKVSGGNTVAFSLSPVPANDEIRVIARSGKRQQIMWMLVDNTGKLYQKGGETLETGISGFSVNLRYLPTGVYLLKFFSKEGYWMPASLSLIKK